jgi:hypothetical protein
MSRKSKKRKKIPFDVQQLREMADSEFYLQVIGYKQREEMGEEILQRSNFLEKKLLKKAINAFNKTDGLLGEVIERTPHSCKFYQLGELRRVLLADNTSLGEQIDKIFQLYIFKMEDIQINNVHPPILKGYAQPYDLHNNCVGTPLEQKVSLFMKRTPTKKIKSGLMCL